jgi:glutaredoxin 3
VPFTVKDIAQDPGARAELMQQGYRATPVTFVDDEVVVGFDRGRLERLLGLA